MLILGIDPGSLKIGYAFIEVISNNFKYINSGIFDYKNIPFNNRLPHIYQNIFDLVKIHHPDEIALEKLIYVKSIPALIKLSQARGAIMAALKDINIYEYAPNLIKSSVTNYGHASKEEIENQLKLIYGSIDFKSYDEADALAIATTHALLRDDLIYASTD